MTPQLDRRPLLQDASIRGAAFCRALSDTFDDWLVELWTSAEAPSSGASLVAVGGYGRAEQFPTCGRYALRIHALEMRGVLPLHLDPFFGMNHT